MGTSVFLKSKFEDKTYNVNIKQKDILQIAYKEKNVKVV